MSVRRACLRALFWIPCVLIQVTGCTGPGQRTDALDREDEFADALGEPPITARRVGQEQMLRRRTQFELRGGLQAPVGLFEDNEFEIGPLLGFKAEIETAKNLFFGLSFDWSHQEVGDSVSELVDRPESLPGIGPDQLFESIDRFNTLLVFDYDITLLEETFDEETPLIFRFGAGIGFTAIIGKEDPETQFEILPFYGFIFRPAVGLRWKVWEHGLVFIETSFDLIAPNRLHADPAGPDDDHSTVDGNIDFSAVNLIAGFAFEI